MKAIYLPVPKSPSQEIGRIEIDGVDIPVVSQKWLIRMKDVIRPGNKMDMDFLKAVFGKEKDKKINCFFIFVTYCNHFRKISVPVFFSKFLEQSRNFSLQQPIISSRKATMSMGLLMAGTTSMATGFLSSLGITMLPVQAGIFQMGDAMLSHSPLRDVTLSSGFRMSETVVTNRAMDAYIQDRGENIHGIVVYDAHGCGYVASVGPKEWPLKTVFSRAHPSLQGLSDLTTVEMAELVPSLSRYERLDSAEIFARPNHPAVEVSWFHALGFLAWLSHKTKIPFKLPTEAQWEYAMRAGRGQRFPYATADGTTLQGVHWSGAGPRQVATAAVDREGAARNPWGFKDGTGQVMEWTASWWSGTDSEGPVTDPLGPVRGVGRVLRGGGSFDDDSEDVMRIGDRGYSEPRYHDNNIGFRVVAPLGFV